MGYRSRVRLGLAVCLVLAFAVPARGEEGAVHVVQPGENLYRIALHYGTTYQELAQANGITDPHHIRVGQRIVIPGAQEAPAPAPPAPVATPQPSPAAGERWIDIDLSDQTLTAYEGETAVRSTAVSTGIPRYPTPTGSFSIRTKYLADDMVGPGYNLPDVPFTMYFYRAYAIHGTYWHSRFGTPMSHGCINLPTAEAEWLFGWAAVGTPVVIHG